MGCALLIGALAVALALSGSLLVALVVLGAPASVGGTLLFAHLRSSGSDTRQMMDIRAIRASAVVGNTRLVGSIVSGPLVAFGAATALGQTGVFAASAAVCVPVTALVGALWVARSRRAATRGRRPMPAYCHV